VACHDRRVTLRAKGKGFSPHAARIAWRDAAQLVAALRDRRDSSPLLHSIRVPTLSIGGREDALSPPKIMAQMATQTEGAHHITLENAGHLSPLEQPEAWNQAVESWMRQAGLK